MEMTPRQFGRLEAVGYALRKYAEKNDVGTVLVGTLEEVLHEIEAADDLHELDGWGGRWTGDDEETAGCREQTAVANRLPGSDLSDLSDLSDKASPAHPGSSDAGLIEDLRAYAAEVADQGAGVVAMLRLVKEHFGLDSARFAALLHVRKQSLTDALNRATVSQNLLARVADFFGDGKRAASDCRGTQKSCLDRVGNKPVDWR